MGVKPETYMVVHKGSIPIKVGDSLDQNGKLVPNPNLSISFDADNGRGLPLNVSRNIDIKKEAEKQGLEPCGGYSSNNGVYAMQAYEGNELILTEDPRIVKALKEQLNFVDAHFDVPLSNGGEICDAAHPAETFQSSMKAKWKNVEISHKLAQIRMEKGEK